MRQFPILLALLLAAPSSRAGEALRLASDDWCPFVCSSGEHVAGGFLVEAAAGALALRGMQAVPLLMPLNRAMQETISGRIEGIYAPAIDARLRLSVPLAHSRACFYTLIDSRWEYRGLGSLAGQRVGIIDDYGYDDGAMDAYVNQHRRQESRLKLAYGQNAGASNLRMLLHGRLPVMLEHEAVMGRLAEHEQASGRLRMAGCLPRSLPLTLGFAADNPKVASWLEALAAGLRQMEASGQLQVLRQRYHLPDPGQPGGDLSDTSPDRTDTSRRSR